MLHPITYVIKHRGPRGEVVAERHDSMTIVPRINELSGRSLADGRNLGEYIVGRLRQVVAAGHPRMGAGRKDPPPLQVVARPRARCYVATAKESPGRRLYGKGFIVERER